MMNEIDFPIERINNFFDGHVFEVYTQPTHDQDFTLPTNVKVKLTGVKEYLSVGEKTPHIQYTMYILPTNKNSDTLNKFYSEIYGKEADISTTSTEYSNLRWVMDRKLSEFLRYFAINKPAICTKVINNVNNDQINESLLIEGKFDYITRELIKDIIKIYKSQRTGEFQLPEDLYSDRELYTFKGIENPFSIGLDLSVSEDVEDFDIDADYYRDEDLILVTIISNPNPGYNNIQKIIGELNETIRHELEHIRQYEQGYKFPKEPKDPVKYYTQQHELEAQLAGFKRRAKQEGKDLETVIRDWFKRNQNKHGLEPKQIEKIIQQIIKNS